MSALEIVTLTCAVCLLLTALGAYVALGLMFSPRGSAGVGAAATFSGTLSAAVAITAGTLWPLTATALAAVLAALCALTAFSSRDR